MKFVQATQVEGVITGTTDSSKEWETLLPNSQNTVNVGGMVSGAVDGQTVSPEVLINGVQCTTTVLGE